MTLMNTQAEELLMMFILTFSPWILVVSGPKQCKAPHFTKLRWDEKLLPHIRELHP